MPPNAASTGSLKRCGRIDRSHSLPVSEPDPTTRMMASLSRATSLTHSPDASSSDDDDAVPGPSGASFSSQRSGSPFTAKRDKSFADVQRFLGDSLSKSASKGMSFAKQLQVSLALICLSFLLCCRCMEICSIRSLCPASYHTPACCLQHLCRGDLKSCCSSSHLNAYQLLVHY